MVQRHQKVLHKKELQKISYDTIDVEEEIEVKKPRKRKKATVKESTKERDTTKFLYLSQFDQTEQKLLKLLWKNGKVKPNEPLKSRKSVLTQAGVLKGKSGVLSNLYAKLLEQTYVEFDKQYKARVSLVEG